MSPEWLQCKGHALPVGPVGLIFHELEVNGAPTFYLSLEPRAIIANTSQETTVNIAYVLKFYIVNNTLTCGFF